MTRINTGYPHNEVGSVCSQCEVDIPEIIHCQWRCANQGNEFVICDCECMFPNQAEADQVAYEMMYDL